MCCVSFVSQDLANVRTVVNVKHQKQSESPNLARFTRIHSETALTCVCMFTLATQTQQFVKYSPFYLLIFSYSWAQKCFFILSYINWKTHWCVSLCTKQRGKRSHMRGGGGGVVWAHRWLNLFTLVLVYTLTPQTESRLQLSNKNWSFECS